MNREMEHINVLAGEIGYRVATTEGEHRAANYIEQEFHKSAAWSRMANGRRLTGQPMYAGMSRQSNCLR